MVEVRGNLRLHGEGDATHGYKCTISFLGFWSFHEVLEMCNGAVQVEVVEVGRGVTGHDGYDCDDSLTNTKFSMILVRQSTLAGLLVSRTVYEHTATADEILEDKQRAMYSLNGANLEAAVDLVVKIQEATLTSLRIALDHDVEAFADSRIRSLSHEDFRVS